jgi:septal ring factor EnvC (AmiA/AmiB activator)
MKEGKELWIARLLLIHVLQKMILESVQKEIGQDAGKRIRHLKKRIDSLEELVRKWKKTARKRRRKYKRTQAKLEEIRHRLIRVRLCDEDWRIRTKEAFKFLDWLLKKLPPKEDEKKLIRTPRKERESGILGKLYQKFFPEKNKEEKK